MTLSESTLEQAVISWLSELGYEYITPEDLSRENLLSGAQSDYTQSILHQHMMDALKRINYDIPEIAIEEAFRKIINIGSANLLQTNKDFHEKIIEGIDLEYQTSSGEIKSDKVWLIDFANPHNNNFTFTNQFTVKSQGDKVRADIVVFVNGLPLAVLELKSPSKQYTTIVKAYNQLEFYKQRTPELFSANLLLVISDGIEAKTGSLTANFERFAPWRTIEGENYEPKGSNELETLIRGVFKPQVLLDLLQSFVVYESSSGKIIKKLAAYHQYWAVKKAVECTLKASKPEGDKRAGVIWHTQGSGKSLSMAFYAGKIIAQMQNPTLVILTDRNDLDDQLFATFASCKNLLRQTPTQASDRRKLKELLSVNAGGVVFTTIQKFAPEQGEDFPLLSDRRNIVVIADEAHRSQYDFIDGFARHMRDGLPNASFIGFTGTPIELSDKDTYAVFGDIIHTYDIHQAVEDGATVKIYYESRLAKINLNKDEYPSLDDKFDEITENHESEQKDKLKSKWARIEALVGTEKRIEKIAHDIVKHFEARSEGMKPLLGNGGKAMIVCMSRRICVEMYNAIIKLRPDWHNQDDTKGFIKVIMTGEPSDPVAFHPHIRSKKARDDIALRYKNDSDELKLVIVRDMWLTGFDAPCMHTMYIDKPMQGHGLMQAIARVNRVYKQKPAGLIVDYIGIADYLRKAIEHYSKKDKEDLSLNQQSAIANLLEKFQIVKDILFGFDYSPAITGKPSERINVIVPTMEFILARPDGRERFVKASGELTKAFALAAGSSEASELRNEVAFFIAIRAALAKHTTATSASGEEDLYMQQIISGVVSSVEIVDIFGAAGLKSPEVSILSEEFLNQFTKTSQKHLALEMLKKMLLEEIKTAAKNNLVQAKHFSIILENTIKKYQSRLVEAAQVIEELITLAKDIKSSKEHGKNLGLDSNEEAFYDALAESKTAKEILGDETLKTIAIELTRQVKNSTTIDWNVKESVKAKIRREVKRILRKYKYPPDQEENAVKQVLAQAEALSDALL